MNRKECVLHYKDEMVQTIGELVAIRSVQDNAQEGMPFGKGCADALTLALTHAESMGFRTVNLDNYAGYAEMGEGEDLIGILCHVDVVPEGEGWTHDPYRMKEENGKLYGRGVCDDKGPAAIAMYAMKIVKEMGIPLKKRIRLVLGANEESGSKCMAYYREKEGGFTMGFSPDADFPLIFGEKGNFAAVLNGCVNGGDEVELTALSGGEAKNVVAPLCKCSLQGNNGNLQRIQSDFNAYAEEHGMSRRSRLNQESLDLELDGISAHASLPEDGKNAISYMIGFLAGVLPKSPFLNGYRDLIGTETDGASCGAKCSDEYGALTLNIGLISLKDNEAQATMDIRYPITVEFEPIAQRMKQNFEQKELHLSDIKIGKPLFVDPESDLVRTLYSAYTEVTGDAEHKPVTIGGGTYAKSFENVVAFGIEFPGDVNRIHMSDEVLNIDRMITATEIYVTAILKLLDL
ncbi:MAG: dipeptidase PepV [Anaerofustis sp.]